MNEIQDRIDNLRERARQADEYDSPGWNDVAFLLGEVDRLREHSVMLNTVGWKMAVALGDASPEDDQVLGDPDEQVDRLIASATRR